MHCVNPAGERNKGPILEVLQKHLPSDKEVCVLEIASGPGSHVQEFAPQFPKAQFQTSELEPSASLHSICKTIDNIHPPLTIDISRPLQEWRHTLPWDTVDAIININMFHICKLNAVQGMFKSAGTLLKPKGFLLTYGPYAKDGNIEPESNVMFHASLRKRNPEWGLRDINYLTQLAEQNGMQLKGQYHMPANNHTLIFVKP